MGGAVKRSRAETPPKAPELLIWMVARDGIEPPTPAFSGPRSTTELPGLSEALSVAIHQAESGAAGKDGLIHEHCAATTGSQCINSPRPPNLNPLQSKPLAATNEKPLNVTALAPVIPFPQPSWEILMSVKKPTRREFLCRDVYSRIGRSNARR